MISIITAIHNQLGVNELFLENLKRYTHHPFELIIIDNNSDDGSAEFFEKNGAIVIRNSDNFSYPTSQNQGIKKSKFDFLAFLNNDIIVAPNWDKDLMEIMELQNLEIITPCGIERVESLRQTKKLGRRWKLIKNPLSMLSTSKWMLKLMHTLMYGNWKKFSAAQKQKFGNKVIEGFVGNTVLFKRSVIEKIGLWDERIQAADFDLYIRSKKRSMEVGDLKPCHIALGVFNHHFIRLTVKSKPTKFVDAKNIIPLNQKWTKEELSVYLKDNLAT